MGCFPCFDSKEEEKLNPGKVERDIDRKEVQPVVNPNVARLSSGQFFLFSRFLFFYFLIVLIDLGFNYQIEKIKIW